ASSPGHPLTPASRSKKRPMGETKAYPSPPDVIQPPSTEAVMSSAISEDMIPMTDEMMGIIETDYETQEYDEFIELNEEPPPPQTSTSLNYLTPAPEPPLSLVTEPTSTQSMNYVPLKFSSHVDEKKYLQGGKFYQPHSRKKRKRGKLVYIYGPDKPSPLPDSKKKKGAKKLIVKKEMSDESEESSDYSSDSGSSTSSESDYDGDVSMDPNNSSTILESNYGSDVAASVNSRNLEFINAGRLTMIFDLHDLHGRRQLRIVNEAESKESSETALKCLSEQIVLGSYPFGVGTNGEGESTHELLESHRCLMEKLSGELPTASVLPFEMGKVITDCKATLDSISNKFPKSQGHLDLSVNGPLTVQKYYNLDGNQDREMKDVEESGLNFQEFSTPDIIASSNDLLIETSPEIVKFWDIHKLTPYDGAKNVKYFVLYPESDHLRHYVEYFIDELRVQYEHLCALGTHEPITMGSYTRGLVPIPLKVPSPNESTLALQIHSYENACERLGKLLIKFVEKLEDSCLVIYLVNPWGHLSSNFDIFMCFSKLHQSLIKNNSNSKFIYPQVIPIDHILKFGKTSGGSFKSKSLLKELAFTVYTKSLNYRAPFILPRPSIVSVNFRWTKKSSS
ncbi:8001_t:CDS:2, partial [Acaulospora morrowiae]